MLRIIDASVVLAWCLKDEVSSYADSVLGMVIENGAIAPAVWPIEVGNGLIVAERRRRLTSAQAIASASLVRDLPVAIRETGAGIALGAALDLARRHGLSVYDATYLDLAMREGLPLATQDARLIAAAQAVGVALVE